MIEAKESSVNTKPFFSVCVPQHNRTSFLIEAIATFINQKFSDFEFCISDGCSTDGRTQELLEYLRASGAPYVYYGSKITLPYDVNTRTAISLARGRYCLLMGNDDAMNGVDALERLHADIVRERFPEVIISDFCDFRTNERAFRIRKYENCGSGPEVAARHFRNFSFVSGIVLQTDLAQEFATDKWDGSEMYQTYIGSRIIGSGGELLERDHQLVRKDIVLVGESVESFATKPRLVPCPIITRRIPLGQLCKVVSNAIEPFVNGNERKRLNLFITLQIIGLTYPLWLFQYRKVQSWKYAMGLALGMRPSLMAAEPLSYFGRLSCWVTFICVTIGGLLLPQGVFTVLRRPLYCLAKWIR